MPEDKVVDFGKFKSYYDQLDGIQMVVDKLVTKKNADVFNKIGTKTEILFNSISQIDVKNSPVEDIRNLIQLLKKLRDTCLILSSYKKYLTEYINNLETAGGENLSNNEETLNNNTLEQSKEKTLQLVSNNMGSAA